jgi:hypothetical protein
LETFYYHTRKKIDLRNTDFLLNNPNITELWINASKGVYNIPVKLEHFPSSVFSIFFCRDKSLVIMPENSVNRLSIGMLDTTDIQIILDSVIFTNIKYLELLSFKSFNIPRNFRIEEYDSLRSLALNISDNRENFKLITKSKSLKRIYIIDCTSYSNLLLLNDLETLEEVLTNVGSKRREKQLKSLSKQLNYRLRW